jgi:drug/metabolite transporter (DMT)-like permease
VIFAGAAILAAGGTPGGDQLVGIVLIATAAALWGIDNNLTQALTTRDPFQLVAAKVGAAAVVNLSIALLLGAAVPTVEVVGAALALGAVSYGISVVLDAYALRELGAAREAAIFATAPFIGMVLSVPVLGESLGSRELVAATVMALGVVVLTRERHDHSHHHEPIAHDHIHDHLDDHHHHDHDPAVDPAERHSHTHQHAELSHAHPHVSDSHHRHDH